MKPEQQVIGVARTPRVVFNDTLRCGWSGVRAGRCPHEVEYAITFTYPPCGCHDEIPNSYRFCLRHMLRAFHSMMGKVLCPNCGREYRGIQRLQSISKL